MTTTASAKAPKRTLHLMDVENLCGGTQPRPEQVRRVRSAYNRQLPTGRDDLVFIAMSHFAAAAILLEWPDSAERRLQSGDDGADLALIEMLYDTLAITEVDRVVIASGDGIFAEHAARLQQKEIEVMVATAYGQLSRRLAFAARNSVDLLADDLSATSTMRKAA